ncbi:hypothetical protein AMK26_10505 [Streptomyces sp. CB03234]|uniref:hypothetical protein n=1 Tax=Streptomyces sp. (strain CB03234) TaxID=1703937 RepID=UPI00093E9ABD|nr:hypothetical protein [Streptomyces sp. CB03234]OKK06440.1 hypothetical protein AMK26_10505 [Streptomyces sp. CB03234]
MTTTPTRPRPTPLDLANAAADRALTRGAVVTDEPFRLLWEKGILRSPLIPHHRLVALALASRADYATGRIPADRQPFLDGLVADTQLNRGQVAVALNVLLQRGWVRRAAKDRYRAYESARLRLTIPALLLKGMRRSS